MRIRSAFLVAPLFALVAACSGGSSGDEEASKETTTTTIPALGADEVDANASPYCATWAKIRAAGGPELGDDAEANKEAMRSHYGKLVPLVEDLRKQAPDDVAGAVDTAATATKAVADSGDDAAFQMPDVLKAQQALAGYAQEHCTKR